MHDSVRVQEIDAGKYLVHDTPNQFRIESWCRALLKKRSKILVDVLQNEEYDLQRDLTSLISSRPRRNILLSSKDYSVRVSAQFPMKFTHEVVFTAFPMADVIKLNNVPVMECLKLFQK